MDGHRSVWSQCAHVGRSTHSVLVGERLEVQSLARVHLFTEAQQVEGGVWANFVFHTCRIEGLWRRLASAVNELVDVTCDSSDFLRTFIKELDKSSLPTLPCQNCVSKSLFSSTSTIYSVLVMKVTHFVQDVKPKRYSTQENLRATNLRCCAG